MTRTASAQPGRASLRGALVLLGAAATAWTGLEIAVFTAERVPALGPVTAYSLQGSGGAARGRSTPGGRRGPGWPRPSS